MCAKIDTYGTYYFMQEYYESSQININNIPGNQRQTCNA